jgi:hypothetical protein
MDGHACSSSILTSEKRLLNEGEEEDRRPGSTQRDRDDDLKKSNLDKIIGSASPRHYSI